MPEYPGAPERDPSVSEFSRDMLDRLGNISAPIEPYEPYTSGDTTDDEGEALLPAVDPDYVTTPPPRKPKTLMEDAAEVKGNNAITALAVGFVFILASNYL